MDELMNELAFQKVLLSSIDNTVQNREAAESEVRAEIRSLEKQIRDLKRGATNTASQSGASTSSQPSQTVSSSSISKNKTSTPTRNGHSAATAMDGYLSKFSLPTMC